MKLMNDSVYQPRYKCRGASDLSALNEVTARQRCQRYKTHIEVDTDPRGLRKVVYTWYVSRSSCSVNDRVANERITRHH